MKWDDPLESLFRNRSTKNLNKLKNAGYIKVSDLLWLLPNHIESIPSPAPFSNALPDQLFQGHAQFVSIQSYFSPSGRGRRGISLRNINLTVKDLLSTSTMTLKWFNAYPKLVKKIQELDQFFFLGKPGLYRGEISIANPQISNSETSGESQLVQYPTVSGIAPAQVEKIISKIPAQLWDQIPEVVPTPSSYSFTRKEAFKVLHGKSNNINIKAAKDYLAYEEFYCDQLKIQARRKSLKAISSFIISKHVNANSYFDYFPYELTNDQKSACEQVASDLRSGHPMMRLLQGDVGCGKTTVAIISALMVIKSDSQVALMCPTESLALQHYIEINKLFQAHNISVELLLGSTSLKEKRRIKTALASGECPMIIGTHALIQDDTKFCRLGLAIIDEQHKFGVNQRLKLTGKNVGVHSLIMSATPIPRSLSLTQYGDLDISVIKELPKNRKPIKTRVVSPKNFGNFLNFLKTRLELGEQAYLVTPAIEDNDDQDLLNVEKVYKRFTAFFPQYRIATLHGKMLSADKQNIFLKFSNHEIDLLISTSVIEVGINVKQATIMTIMNPERFGLSSLHQLRGRVGRGQKPGFCFLVCDQPPSSNALERLSIIEKYIDGFTIAEHDLRLRGEGELFGTDQAGAGNKHRIANIIIHYQQLIDSRKMLSENDPEKCKLTQSLLAELQESQTITSTI